MLHNAHEFAFRDRGRRSGARAAAPGSARAPPAGAAPGAVRPRRHALRRRRRLVHRAAPVGAARLARRGLAGARGRRGLGAGRRRARLRAGAHAARRRRGGADAAARRGLRAAARGRAGRPARRRRARLPGGGPGGGAGRLLRALAAGGDPGRARAAGRARRRAARPTSPPSPCCSPPGLLYPVVTALSGFGAAQASRAQFDALQRLSGRFLDRLRGLPTLVLFNRQEAEATALGDAAEELRARTLRVLRLAFLATTALELLAALVHRPPCLAPRGPPRRDGAAAAAIRPPRSSRCSWCPLFFAPLRAFSAAYHERLSAEGAAAALAPLLLPRTWAARPAPGGDPAARGGRLLRRPAGARPGAAAGAGRPHLPRQRRRDAGAGGAVRRGQDLRAAAADGLRAAGWRPGGDQRAGRDRAAPVRAAAPVGLCRPAPAPVPRDAAREHPPRPPGCRRTRRWRTRRAPRAWRISRPPCRRASTRWWARAAGAFPAGRRSAWRSPAPFCATRRWCCWTSRPRISIPARKRRWWKACAASASAAPPSSPAIPPPSAPAGAGCSAWRTAAPRARRGSAQASRQGA